ncbi:hypothetical protein [Sinorhizobium meliloti]|uniref:hypothetical protein n=1 Tax=Rhizobium meliloti TaxID=382 RepID=UPI0003105BD7|nr:hypothetical protein [Sinorhizobium meliloti]MBP2470636.1 superfamily II DNA or RNA helicase [Sinorhizobium meliloti]MDE4550476.1 hypothetical protein [Sinorhizobium meliloti]MDE4563289.1 hypothetical protein [Sinorhizobium meliloti SM11]MDE4598104.1 hypothetical protein [Sinorhizobium meliloti]MDE4604788.1 hypothetical protein [Sinorhizobium meliloti]
MEWSPGPGIKVGEKSRSAARRHVRKRPQASQCGLNVPDDAERLILATGRYIGEGFDDARLDMLFLTMPIAWKRTLAQYIGRLHRQHDDRKTSWSLIMSQHHSGSGPHGCEATRG